jgi:hypothetical protein
MEKQYNQIEKLNDHKIIGLDMDETLVGGPCSYILREWVKENFINKELWIVTFRVGVYVPQVWSELASFHINRRQFAGLKSLPNALFNDYCEVKKAFKYKDTNPNKFQRFLNAHKWTEEEAQRKHDALLHWKGETCASIGATVLVDDLPEMVIPGCKANNITLIHSHYL